MRPVTLACLLATLLPTGALSQTLLTGDHSIDGRLCVGSACTGSESFPGDVDFKVKELDPRIRFEDTSTTSGLATVDWELQANQLSGSASFFAIRNVDANTTILHLENDAGLNAIYASDSGVGLGTSIPQAGLDVVGARSNLLRMERTNTTSGSQTYALQIDTFGRLNLINPNSGHGLGAFVVNKDAPRFALEIIDSGVIVNSFSDADQDFVVKANNNNNLGFDGATGNTNLGQKAAVAPLHVNRADGTARIVVEEYGGNRAAREMFRMENNGGSYFTLRDSSNGREWYFVHENNPQGRFFINHSDGGQQMSLTRTGDMRLMGQLFTGGSCAAGCDRVFDEDYPLPAFSEQMAAIRSQGHLPNVGPTDEDGPFNLSQMSTGMLNELEKAYLYIDQLEGRVAELEARQGAFDALAARLDSLEAAAAE